MDIKWDVSVTGGFEFCLAQDKAFVLKKIRESDVLWLHGWDSIYKLRMLKIAQKNSLPVLMRGENTQTAMPDGKGIKGFLKKLYLHYIFNCCDGFLCIGKENKDYYKEHGVREEKLFFMPYTVDNNFFQYHANNSSDIQEKLRSELGIDPKSSVILFVGKLQKRKNPDILLDAFRLLDRNALQHPWLLFIGTGDMMEELKEKEKNYETGVKFLGFKNQSELSAYYSLADIFVLPSEREPWGLVVNEAMNCETAVIVSDQCGCASDLIDSSCGYILPTGNIIELSNLLKSCLEQPNLTKIMGKNSRSKIDSWGLPESIVGLKRACFQLRRSLS